MTSRERALPKSRLNRLSHLGKLAGGVAGGVIGESFRQIKEGKRPSLERVLLTPANAQRVADRLAEMRGAAMKVGQLLSMESGEFLPPELTQILSKLRKDAYIMPLGEVAQVLNSAWGKGWESQFSQFSFTPLAAASIGQVHRATLKTGEQLAIKVQYPGVRESIDSDVDNVATLLRLTRLIPKEIDFTALLQVAKEQLHTEADYEREADYLQRFARLLENDDRFQVPKIHAPLTCTNVIAMEFMEGAPLEEAETLPQAERDSVSEALLDLVMMEIFDWGLLQSDPNFANFLYDAESKRIQLLDFGATREIPPERSDGFQQLLVAADSGDSGVLLSAARALGYVELEDPRNYRQAIVDLISTACAPFKQSGVYDFSSTGLANEIADITIELRMKEKFGRLPPPDVLFLHRKLAGLYLLFTRLGSRIAVRDRVSPYLNPVANFSAA